MGAGIREDSRSHPCLFFFEDTEIPAQAEESQMERVEEGGKKMCGK